MNMTRVNITLSHEEVLQVLSGNRDEAFKILVEWILNAVMLVESEGNCIYAAGIARCSINEPIVQDEQFTPYFGLNQALYTLYSKLLKLFKFRMSSCLSLCN